MKAAAERIKQLLTAVIGDVYPIVADRTAGGYAYAVYRRASMNVDKDLCCIANYEIKIVAKSYTELQEATRAAINAFLLAPDCERVDDLGEEYTEDCYVSTISVGMEGNYLAIIQ